MPTSRRVPFLIVNEPHRYVSFSDKNAVEERIVKSTSWMSCMAGFALHQVVTQLLMSRHTLASIEKGRGIGVLFVLSTATFTLTKDGLTSRPWDIVVKTHLFILKTSISEEFAQLTEKLINPTRIQIALGRGSARCDFSSGRCQFR